MSERTSLTRRLGLAGLRAPKPLLSAETERQLSARQVELIDELEERVAKGGLADLTMAEIAKATNCSLRTLYGIAPSKDDLVLAIVDRRLRRIGRAAIETLVDSMEPLEALRTYLAAANEAVQPESVAYSGELAHVQGAQELLDAHEGYLMAVTQRLLDRAVEAKRIDPVDTASVAHVLGGLGREFARPSVARMGADSPKKTADAITDIMLRGLERS